MQVIQLIQNLTRMQVGSLIALLAPKKVSRSLLYSYQYRPVKRPHFT